MAREPRAHNFSGRYELILHSSRDAAIGMGGHEDQMIIMLNKNENPIGDATKTAWRDRKLYMEAAGGDQTVVRDFDVDTQWDALFWSHWNCKYESWRGANGDSS